MTKRGRVLRDTNIGPGLLTVEGTQYAFLLEGMWRSEVPPRTGMAVDVRFNDEGVLAEVYAVSEGHAVLLAEPGITTAEKKGQGKTAIEDTSINVALIVEGPRPRSLFPLIVAELTMLLSFFALPSLRFESVYSGQGLSGWDTVGFDPATTIVSHGLPNLIAISCLSVPIAAPFIKHAWARLLYCAPLSFTIFAVIELANQIQDTSRVASNAVRETFGGAAACQMAQHIGGNFSMGAGAYLVIFCSIYLLTRAFKPTWPSS